MPTTTGHVGINVTSLDRSHDFYADVFQLTRIGGSDDAGRRFAFLGDGERLVLTLWEQSDGRFDGRTPGLHHLSFEVASMDDVRAAEERLRARGATFAYEGIVPHREGAQSGGIFFEDPDGTRLEIYAKDGTSGAAPVAGAPTCGFF
ncbi:MAG TPA: VOC family protein [Thermoanaerobaculia bacterium]|nr:VOC family protein [Thermoanaerobaculia bacterium]